MIPRSRREPPSRARPGAEAAVTGPRSVLRRAPWPSSRAHPVRGRDLRSSSRPRRGKTARAVPAARKRAYAGRKLRKPSRASGRGSIPREWSADSPDQGRWPATLGVDVIRENGETWDGKRKTEGSLGRTDGLVWLSVGRPFGRSGAWNLPPRCHFSRGRSAPRFATRRGIPGMVSLMCHSPPDDRLTRGRCASPLLRACTLRMERSLTLGRRTVRNFCAGAPYPGKRSRF